MLLPASLRVPDSSLFAILNVLVFGAMGLIAMLFPDLPEETTVQLARQQVVYDRLIRAMEHDKQLERLALLGVDVSDQWQTHSRFDLLFFFRCRIG